MPAENKKAIEHLDASNDGQESKKGAEAPVGVDGGEVRRDEGRKVGDEEGRWKDDGERRGVKVGVPDCEAVEGKPCEWASTVQSSSNPGNQGRERPHVVFSRDVLVTELEMVEGPGTRNKRRVAAGDVIGTTVQVLAKPNMNTPREPDELSQERIRAILGDFHGAPPVNAFKPNHCRATCKRGPCNPETCSCSLGGVKCSIDAKCSCGPSNCGNYEDINPIRDIVRANEKWKEIRMPEINETIRSVDPNVEAPEVARVSEDDSEANGLMESFGESSATVAERLVDEVPVEEKQKKSDGGSDDDGKIEKDREVGAEESSVLPVAVDRFVNKRRRMRRAVEDQAEMSEQVSAHEERQTPRPPNNVQARPSDVRHWMCYSCGTICDTWREYQLHVMYHQLTRVAHGIRQLEPSFGMQVSSSSGHASQCIDAPFVTVRRGMKRKSVEGSPDEPEAKRRRTILVDDVVEGVQRLDDRFVTIRRRRRDQDLVDEEEEEEVDLMMEDDDDLDVAASNNGGQDVMDLEEMYSNLSVADETIGMEEDDESSNYEGSAVSSELNQAEMERKREVDRIIQMLMDANILKMPIDEARDLVNAVNASRNGDGLFVIVERQAMRSDVRCRITTVVDGVKFEGADDIENEAKTRLHELVRLVSLCFPFARALNLEDQEDGPEDVTLETPRFASTLGERISLDGFELDEFEGGDDSSVIDHWDSLGIDRHSNDQDEAPIDGVEGSERRSEGSPRVLDDVVDDDGEGGDNVESDSDDDEVRAKHSMQLEPENLGDQISRMLPTMLKDDDFKSCSEDTFITENALFCGLMQEVSATNRKGMKCGVLPPSIFKDWNAGKKMTKAEMDENLFNRDPKLILIPIYHPSRVFEGGRIEHWSLGLYDIAASSVTIYDSIGATNVERGVTIGTLRELMQEWLGDEEAGSLRYRYARSDRVEKQAGTKHKTSSGIFVLVHARRLVQLEKDVSTRGRTPVDVEDERKRLWKTMKMAEPDFKKTPTPTGSSQSQQQQNQRKRKLPALITPDYIKARRNNSGTRDKIRRCYMELKKRC